MTTKRNSLPRSRIHTTLQKQTGIFVLAGRSNQKAYNHNDNFRWITLKYVPALASALSRAHTPCLGRKCLDWLMGTAAPHRKLQLHSFPSACRWSFSYQANEIPPNSAKSCIFEGTANCQRIKAESQGTAAQRSNLSISGQILPAVDWMWWAKMIRGDNSGDSSSFAAKLSPWCKGGDKP